MAKINKLKEKITSLNPNVKVVQENEIQKSIPQMDTQNLQGHNAYSLDKWFRLLSMLNTLKVEPQYYKNELEILDDLKNVLNDCASEDPYKVAQCIVYSRCLGNGMRTVNSIASAFLAKWISGTEWSKRFYSRWNKKENKGGCIYRLDDISEITEAYHAYNKYTNPQGQLKTKAITNPMKKGFANILENSSTYELLKYKNRIIDIINITHPNPKKSREMIEWNGENISPLTAIIKNYNISADTWETNSVKLGQEVADAVKSGSMTQEEANKTLSENKELMWDNLLREGKLGILAALRNIRNILKNLKDDNTFNLLNKLLGNEKLIKEGLILPFQIDTAITIIQTEFNTDYSREIIKTLSDVYEKSIPNLKEVFKGNNLVIVDCSGSMTTSVNINGSRMNSSCLDKAALIGATIALGCNADIIVFGSRANYHNYNPKSNVFDIANALKGYSLGGTSIGSAFDLIKSNKRKYDRIFILSDNECNTGNTLTAYKDILGFSNPYVFSIDMAVYGTTQFKGEKVRYLYGYGASVFDEIINSEFNPEAIWEKVLQVQI